MVKNRIFIYNPSGSNINGTNQYGFLAVADDFSSVSQSVLMNPSFECWSGPDENLGYVIAYTENSGNRPNAPERILGGNVPCHIGFKRTKTKNKSEFINLASQVAGQQFTTAYQSKVWLESNGFWTSYGQIATDPVLYLDSRNHDSYPGTGIDWYDLSGYGNNATLRGGAFFSNDGSINFGQGGQTGDFAEFNNPVNIPVGDNPYTISVWFNSNVIPSNGGLVGWGQYGAPNQVNALRLLNNGGNTGLINYWWGNDLSVQTPLSSSTWYNVVVAYQSGNRSIYLNSAMIAQDFANSHNVNDSTNLRIGVTHEPFNEWFNGKIAQVVIYKRKLTDEEIEAFWISDSSTFGY